MACAANATWDWHQAVPPRHSAVHESVAGSLHDTPPLALQGSRDPGEDARLCDLSGSHAREDTRARPRLRGADLALRDPPLGRVHALQRRPRLRRHAAADLALTGLSHPRTLTRTRSSLQRRPRARQNTHATPPRLLCLAATPPRGRRLLRTRRARPHNDRAPASTPRTRSRQKCPACAPCSAGSHKDAGSDSRSPQAVRRRTSGLTGSARRRPCSDPRRPSQPRPTSGPSRVASRRRHGSRTRGRGPTTRGLGRSSA